MHKEYRKKLDKFLTAYRTEKKMGQAKAEQLLMNELQRRLAKRKLLQPLVGPDVAWPI
jgi:hypothetical protein